MTSIVYETRIDEVVNADAKLILMDKVLLEQLHNDSELSTLMNDQLVKYVSKQFEKGCFKGGKGQSLLIPTLGSTAEEYLFLLGIESSADIHDLREVMAVAALKMKSMKLHNLIIDARLGSFPTIIEKNGASLVGQMIVEGLELALYDVLPTKKVTPERYELGNITIIGVSQEEDWNQGILKGQQLVSGVQLARNLTNMPGNDLTPERLAFYAEQLAHEHDLDIEVMDEWTLAEEGMGGLLGVGQGSINPPRMIVLHYEGAKDDSTVWGLVGKGITFDTGGISLKPAAGMEEMISDMGGAAAVLGAMKAIAMQKVQANVIAVIPTAENMPSDRALKPGDIIQTMSGYTVEVVNTDAEGRLVLADGLTTVIKRGATKIIDVATLTGAVLVALGTEATGAVTNNEQLMREVQEAAKRSGERVWELPAYPEYKKLIKSDVADLKNSGGRHAGTITGGLFVGHFAEDKPWVHLDIAGTAFINKSRKWETKGATGVMVRTLFELISNSDR